MIIHELGKKTKYPAWVFVLEEGDQILPRGFIAARGYGNKEDCRIITLVRKDALGENTVEIVLPPAAYTALAAAMGAPADEEGRIRRVQVK